MADPVSINSIQFFSLQQRLNLRQRQLLKHFIIRMFRLEKKKFSHLSIVFCSDQYLLKINRDFLNHNYYTDIITFDLSDQRGDVKGEIYISLPRVKENARIFKNPVALELLRVIFHGVLHLCGYKDSTPVEKQAMRKREAHYLLRYENYVSRGTYST